jgi:hypothetical protein
MVVYWKDEDVLWESSDDVEFYPKDVLEVQSPVHKQINSKPLVLLYGVPAVEQYLSVRNANHKTISTPLYILYGGELAVRSANHELISSRPAIVRVNPAIDIQSASHKLTSYPAELTTGTLASPNSGQHDNTQHIIYNAHNYLRCKHQGGNLVGTYTGPIFDYGSADRYLAYIV